MAILIGHEGEISRFTFNPQSSKVLTASSDKTARLWDTETGDCLQILEGHTDEIFSCAFNYAGTTIISGSKDNTQNMEVLTRLAQFLYIICLYLFVIRFKKNNFI